MVISKFNIGFITATLIVISLLIDDLAGTYSIGMVGSLGLIVLGLLLASGAIKCLRSGEMQTLVGGNNKHPIMFTMIFRKIAPLRFYIHLIIYILLSALGIYIGTAAIYRWFLA